LYVLAPLAIATPARATEGPLLVAVEVAPGARCDAAAVREAIAAELRTPVVGLGSPAAAASSDALIVTIDNARIGMSLRARSDQVVTRTVPAPAHSAARLRAIAWLADARAAS
jgi:hypothetical protein